MPTISKTDPDPDLLAVFTPIRLRILVTLASCREAPCGCDLIDQLAISKTLLTYHLAALQKADLISASPCGQRKRYLINPKRAIQVQQILTAAGITARIPA